MIVELRLNNFRGFGDHVVPLRPMTYMVGRNNAGKSTIIEGLTLVSLVVNRWGRLESLPVPDWLDEAPPVPFGVRPSLQGFVFESATVFHHYAEPPAFVEGVFHNGERVRVYVGPEGRLWANAVDADGVAIPVRGRGATTRLPKIAVLPQVAPLASREIILESRYVQSNASAPSGSQHFRNQLFRDLVHFDGPQGRVEEGEFYPEFVEMAGQTWPGLAITSLVYGEGRRGEELSLYLRDADFVNEVGRMGHGLQMWLQTLWFLARSRDYATVVLDEPDVYTHADVQHRLVRLLARRPNPQKIIATHSVEILSEATPAEVLVIDRARDRSGFAVALPDVQDLVNRMGGVHSLQLARLWTAKRVLLLEGKDIELLRIFHSIMYPVAADGLDALPRMSIGGWTGFPYALGGGMLLRNAAGESIRPYCILDSDFHTLEEIESRYRSAGEHRVELHIWQRKEIESYVLVPSAIERRLRAGAAERAPSEQQIAQRLDQVAEGLRQEAFGALVEEQIQQLRRKDARRAEAGRALEIVQPRFEELWRTQEGRWSLCNAKSLLAGLSAWTQDQCGVNLNAVAIARMMRVGDIPEEMRTVVAAIERGEPFPEALRQR